MGNGMTNDTLSINHQIVPTGVPGLDQILGDGLLSANLYLIEGRAGAGKTILANQIAFHRASQGERVLYVTLVAESHGKLLNHLRRLSFFQESHIANSIQFLSGYQALTERGLSGLLQVLFELMSQHQPSLMVLDGIRAALHAQTDEMDLAKFLHQLDVLVTGSKCTTLLLSPIGGEDSRPEHTLVDGIVEVSVHERGLRRVRFLEVRKLRGARHLTGQHVMHITEHGIRVFPRLEGLSSLEAPSLPLVPRRDAFGIPTFDPLIAGGVMAGSTTAIIGAPGAGKTMFGLSFLSEGLRRGDPVEYFGFYESPERLIAKAAAAGITLPGAGEEGRLRMHWHPPVEQSIDELAHRLLTSVERSKATRLFLDGLGGLRDCAATPERVSQFVTALTARLRQLGVTTVVSEELPLLTESAAPAARLSPTVENVVLLRYVESASRFRRLLSIVKMRENSYDPMIREFAITAHGIVVGTPFRAESPSREHAPGSIA